MSEVLHTTDASFEADVISSNIPVLVDLWAPWCGPCRMVAPILDELASELAGKVKIVKINVDENQAIPAQCLFSNKVKPLQRKSVRYQKASCLILLISISNFDELLTFNSLI